MKSVRVCGHSLEVCWGGVVSESRQTHPSQKIKDGATKMCACEFVRGNQARGTVDLSVGRHLAAYQTNHHAGAVIILDPQ